MMRNAPWPVTGYGAFLIINLNESNLLIHFSRNVPLSHSLRHSQKTALRIIRLRPVCHYTAVSPSSVFGLGHVAERITIGPWSQC